MSQARGIHNREEDLADKADVCGDWSVYGLRRFHGRQRSYSVTVRTPENILRHCGSF